VILQSLEAISKPQLSSDIYVAVFFKILTYAQYAAFFREPAFVEHPALLKKGRNPAGGRDLEADLRF
jgi:hypothetical protein